MTNKSEYSLKKMRSEFISIWDFELNDVQPNSIYYRSKKNIHWLCPHCNEKFQMPVNKMIVKPFCPKCNRVLVVRNNSLKKKRPELSKQFNYELNKNLYPELISYQSNLKYFFKCKCGTSELRAPNKIVYDHIVCNKCIQRYRTSFFEQALYFYCSKYFDDVKNRYLVNGVEIDIYIYIYIPNLRIGIEYDGSKFHENTFEKTIEKRKKINELGIRLINVEEITRSNKNCSKYLSYDDLIIVYSNSSYIERDNCILAVLSKIDNSKKYDIDFKRDSTLIYKYLLSRFPENDLFIDCDNPKLLNEYSPDNIIPIDKIGLKYPYKVKWKCEECGHIWCASVYNRIICKYGCPVCKSSIFKSGVNDLQTRFPFLVSNYWDFEKNNKLNLFPNDFFPSSNQKVYWINEKNGDSEFRTIASRVKKFKKI